MNCQDTLRGALDGAIHAYDVEYQFLAQQAKSGASCDVEALSSSVEKLHATPQTTTDEPHKWLNYGTVKGVEVWNNDIVVRREPLPKRRGQKREGDTIKTISRASIKNAQFILANTEVEFSSLITLTYPKTYPTNGKIVNAHFRALHERMRRRFGSQNYFSVREFQKRGAAHFHIAIDIDLAELGDVETVTRGKMSRRRAKFNTVKPIQNWLFEAWVDIISKPKKGWSGLSVGDIDAMAKAYYEYNSGVSWEVMRKKDGAKRYLVKELSSLKSYQKRIPEGFEAPGRTFLYNPEVKPTGPKVCFKLSALEVMELLREIGFEHLPHTIYELCNTVWNISDRFLAGIQRFFDDSYQITSEKLAELCEVKPRPPGAMPNITTSYVFDGENFSY